MKRRDPWEYTEGRFSEVRCPSDHAAKKKEESMPAATQKTPDQAAALLQARVRGRQLRRRQRQAIHGITKLQARQRGRFTRREYAKLLEFYGQQESFLAEATQRQHRIWRQEQELHFLQHTTSTQLERIRTFQYHRSAARIQREWRRSHPLQLSELHSDSTATDILFDPFGFTTTTESRTLNNAGGDNQVLQELLRVHVSSTDKPKCKPLLQLNADEMAKRRNALHNRIAQLRREGEQRQAVSSSARTSLSRRELYDRLMALRTRTSQRLQHHKTLHQSQRTKRLEEMTQISASCHGRLVMLQDRSRMEALLMDPRSRSLSSAQQSIQQQERDAFERHQDQKNSDWSAARKRRAWDTHSKVVGSVLGDKHWHTTFLAGHSRDIRQVHASSPFDTDRKIWQWPPSAKPFDEELSQHEPSCTPASALDQFVFSMNQSEPSDAGTTHSDSGTTAQCSGMTAPEAVTDREASRWWQAHCTQSHVGYTHPSARLHSQAEQGDAQVTPEMLVPSVFLELVERSKQTRKQAATAEAVAARRQLLEQRIQDAVATIETSVAVNTRLLTDAQARERHAQQRQRKQAQAVLLLQRVMRGVWGRRQARVHFDTYYVRVQDRIVRRGQCYECTTRMAVLECRQCDQLAVRQLCPSCWVAGHRSEPRQSHVAIPMAATAAEAAATATVEKTTKPPVATRKKATGEVVVPQLRLPVRSGPLVSSDSVLVSKETSELVVGQKTKTEQAAPATVVGATLAPTETVHAATIIGEQARCSDQLDPLQIVRGAESVAQAARNEQQPVQQVPSRQHNADTVVCGQEPSGHVESDATSAALTTVAEPSAENDAVALDSIPSPAVEVMPDATHHHIAITVASNATKDDTVALDPVAPIPIPADDVLPSASSGTTTTSATVTTSVMNAATVFPDSIPPPSDDTMTDTTSATAPATVMTRTSAGTEEKGSLDPMPTSSAAPVAMVEHPMVFDAAGPHSADKNAALPPEAQGAVAASEL